jgi:hypothetical protein
VTYRLQDMTKNDLCAFALLAASVAGCGAPIDDGAVPAADVTETQGALGGSVYNVINGSVNIGSTASQTCVLAGMAGNLAGASGGEVGVYHNLFTGPDHDTYDVFALPCVGYPMTDCTGVAVRATFSCVATTAGRLESPYWTPTDPPLKLAAVTARRQCFLSFVQALDDKFTADTDTVSVWNDGTSWFLDGEFLAKQNPSHAAFAATCVNLPAGTNVTTGITAGPPTGVYTTDIAYDTGGTLCALTGIQGKFNRNNTEDGAIIQWPSSLPGYWTIKVKAGKAASWTCMQ